MTVRICRRNSKDRPTKTKARQKCRALVFGIIHRMEDWLDLNPDPAHVRREREKARELRKSDWWRALVAKGVCHYCHRNVGAENLTLDHVVPVSRGGRSTRGNCVPCCKECNNAKKSYTPAEQVLARLFPDDAQPEA